MRGFIRQVCEMLLEKHRNYLPYLGPRALTIYSFAKTITIIFFLHFILDL